MMHLEKLINRIVDRVNVNLRKPGMDVGRYVKDLIPEDSHALYYAFYALTPDHPLHFHFHDSSLAGTYFLGKTKVAHSVLYKSDIRGDELKRKGSVVSVDGVKITMYEDEIFNIKHSFLVKTLVHNCSRDPEDLEHFTIINTVSLNYANIHGTPVEGCYIGAFATVDLSTLRNCIVGEYSYVQAGSLSDQEIGVGHIWIKLEGLFEFDYQHPKDVLRKYITYDEHSRPVGKMIDFIDSRKTDFDPIYTAVQPIPPVEFPAEAHVSPYAVIKGKCEVGAKVLVAQRSYIENSVLGEGSNAQENCYIVNSNYEGFNVTAHGGKVVYADLGRNTFTGFNSFIYGSKDARIKVGRDCIIMPHTIIDAEEPIEIPDAHLVWGYITKQEDLELHTISLDEFKKLKSLQLGSMNFQGSGAKFVEGFKHRIEHILEENGAFFDGKDGTRGHAQKTQDAAFHIVQAYTTGPFKGMCPTMTISELDEA